jgi:hypothetical protein
MNEAVATLTKLAHGPLNGEAVTKSSDVLDEVHTFLGRFVAYPSVHAQIAHTLWIAHTHLMDQWESTPRLAFLSPEPGSGKTRALEITETLVPRPVEAVNATPAYLFRKVSDKAGRPTILFDEIDTIFGPRAKEHEEIRGILNAGHRRGAQAGRCIVQGATIKTEELPAFCAVAIAGIGNLPDTILTRAVVVKMRRRAPTEQVEPYRRRIHSCQGYQLRDRLAAWAIEICPRLNPFPDMPPGITDRPADVWEALLSVADAAGEPWSQLARVSAVSLVSASAEDRGSLGIRLLTDLQTLFGSSEAMFTEDILLRLVSVEEAPWGDLRGKPIDAHRLAKCLKPYGVSPLQVRINKVSQKGYTRDTLEDAWRRYLPAKASQQEEQPSSSSAKSETPETKETPNGSIYLESEEVNLYAY